MHLCKATLGKLDLCYTVNKTADSCSGTTGKNKVLKSKQNKDLDNPSTQQ